MITTVTLNPCIDLTVRVPALQTGALNLVSSTRSDVGGKGINVSVSLRALGLPTFCTGISFAEGGQQLEGYLERHSISRRFAVAGGSVRTNIKLYDDASGEMTEINHPGYPVGMAVVAEYRRILRECAENSEVVVFSGRIPAGADDAIYRESIKLLRNLPVKVVVDAEGRPLREALRQKPYLIKPNLREMEALARRRLRSREEVAAACQGIIRRGVGVVCVSLGGDGAVIVDKSAAFYAPALEVEVRGLQGAGDSMVAGLCKGIKEKAGIERMLCYGVAAASASVLREGTQLCRGRDFERLLPLVRPERIPLSAAVEQEDEDKQSQLGDGHRR